MTRIETWPAELARLLLEYHTRPFDPASNNCAQFAAEWVRRATGEVIELPPVTEHMISREWIAEHGGLQALVAARLGDPLASPALAHRGDVGITDSPLGEALCVVVGPTIAAPNKNGLIYLRRARLVTAWRI